MVIVNCKYSSDELKEIYMATPCLAMAPLINKMMIQMTQQTGQDLLQVFFIIFPRKV